MEVYERIWMGAVDTSLWDASEEGGWSYVAIPERPKLTSSEVQVNHEVYWPGCGVSGKRAPMWAVIGWSSFRHMSGVFLVLGKMIVVLENVELMLGIADA